MEFSPSIIQLRILMTVWPEVMMLYICKSLISSAIACHTIEHVFYNQARFLFLRPKPMVLHRAWNNRSVLLSSLPPPPPQTLLSLSIEGENCICAGV